MKRMKLMFPSIILALALIFTSAQSVRLYADTSDPQGREKTSTSTEAPPTPSAEVINAIRIVISIMMSM